MQENIKLVTVKKTVRQAYRTEPIWQYDVGHVLNLEGFDNLPETFQMHYSHSPMGDAITQIGSNGQVSLPDEFAQTSAPIFAWVYVAENDTGLTKYTIEIPVMRRARITNQEPTPVEQSAIDQAISALNAGVSRAETAAANAEASEDAASASAESAYRSSEAAAGAAESAAGDASAAERSATAAGESASAASGSATAAAGSAAAAAQTKTEIDDEVDGFQAQITNLSSALNQKITEPEQDGTDGQVLATNGQGGRYWKTVSGGGGGGTDDYTDLTNKPQINGVTLSGNKSLSDLGAASASDVAAKYAKPASGIPASDLSAAVQTSLGKADTALQGQDVTEAVDDYLSENFSNPSNPPLDRTLSSALSAAPADIVGDIQDGFDSIVSTQKEWINHSTLLPNKYYKNANGETGYSSGGKYVVDGSIPIEEGHVYYFKDIDTRYTWFVYEDSTSGSITTGNSKVESGTFTAADDGIIYITCLSTALWTESEAIYDRGTQADMTIVNTDTTLEDGAMPANSKAVGDAISEINSTVENVEDDVNDVKSNLETNELVQLDILGTWGDYIPVEYGGKYTANFSMYDNRIFLYNSAKEELGYKGQVEGLTITQVWSYYRYKYVYEITSPNIAYIRYRNANKPSGAIMYKGDIELNQYVMLTETVIPKEPAMGRLYDTMFTEHDVSRSMLNEDLDTHMAMLGYVDKPLKATDLYNYNSGTDYFAVNNGMIAVQNHDDYADVTTASILYLDKNIYSVEYNFGPMRVTGSTSLNSSYALKILLQSNIGHSGFGISFNSTGGKPNGVGYIQEVTEQGVVYSRDASISWQQETLFAKVKIVRYADSIDVILTQGDGVEVTNHYTYAQLHVTDPDRICLYTESRRSSDTMVLADEVKVSAYPSVGGSSSLSNLANSVYDAWGDSYTAPAGSYCAIIGEEKGCSAVNNYGVSGDKVSSVLTRINNTAADSGAYVTVLAGVNDYLHDTPMADFRTAVQDVITALIGKSVSAKFAWILPPQIGITGQNNVGLELEAYVNAIAEICAANSVPVLDMFHAGGWYGTVAAFRNVYMSTDNLHPNSVGQNFLAHKIGEFLERL